MFKYLLKIPDANHSVPECGFDGRTKLLHTFGTCPVDGSHYYWYM